MAGLKDMVQWRTFSGDQVTIGDVTVTPQSRALTIRWPNGGFVWNRPVAVLVERDGSTERVPIVDVTLVARMVLFALSLALSMFILLLSVRKRRKRNE